VEGFSDEDGAAPALGSGKVGGEPIAPERALIAPMAGPAERGPPSTHVNGFSDPIARSPLGCEAPVYGALDLGTNNCRLLLARPSRRGFRVIDAFSRIIRLGEGVSQTGRLSEAAMERTMDALRVCAGKMARNHVRRARLVATEACRVADNGAEFLARVKNGLDLDIEILSREAEARLAVSGCASLVDPNCVYVLVFDIGGGSSELIWLDLTRRRPAGRPFLADRSAAQACMAAWTSLPVGVVTLAERFGGRHVTREAFEAMVDCVAEMLAPFEREHGFRERTANARTHLLGTSGTVTTLAGIQLGLPRYDRNRVDGCWLDVAGVQDVTYDLLARSYEERVAEPCIGRDRADLVLAGCAILEALLRLWPCERLRVADRGLREGILATLMAEDGAYRTGRRRRSRGHTRPADDR
jgi:exopolyphosphatase / guanosine-5'-triphosphate,3'-diphosphate pyrophosphatase